MSDNEQQNEGKSTEIFFHQHKKKLQDITFNTAFMVEKCDNLS